MTQHESLRDVEEFEKYCDSIDCLDDGYDGHKQSFLAGIASERERSLILENCIVSIMEGSDIQSSYWLMMERALKKFRGEN